MKICEAKREERKGEEEEKSVKPKLETIVIIIGPMFAGSSKKW